MRIAFYAPLKPPGAPVPPGDCHMTRLLMTALEQAGHRVELASVFRSRDGAGDPARQQRPKDLGTRLADWLLRRYGGRPPADRPAAWFTYHLYYRAPDWLGPVVSAALGIPYIVAEASYAPKREGGPWALDHEAAGAAIRRADTLIRLNSHNEACVRPLLDDQAKLMPLSPFTDTGRFAMAPGERTQRRERLNAEFGLDPDVPLLLTVAMMRPGNKMDSYRMLSAALEQLGDRPWQLLVCGDGPARSEVEAALSPLGDRAHMAGLQAEARLPSIHASADLFVWPAVIESYGMAVLDAQMAGVPVVAGKGRGVADIVRDGETGLLAEEGDAAGFADGVWALLDAPERRTAMAAQTAKTATSEHSVAAVVGVLNRALEFASANRRAA